MRLFPNSNAQWLKIVPGLMIERLPKTPSSIGLLPSSGCLVDDPGKTLRSRKHETFERVRGAKVSGPKRQRWMSRVVSYSLRLEESALQLVGAVDRVATQQAHPVAADPVDRAATFGSDESGKAPKLCRSAGARQTGGIGCGGCESC